MAAGASVATPTTDVAATASWGVTVGDFLIRVDPLDNLGEQAQSGRRLAYCCLSVDVVDHGCLNRLARLAAGGMTAPVRWTTCSRT